MQLLDDKVFEGNETFYIELTNAMPAYHISGPVTTITIRDEVFREGDGSEGKALSFIRTGDNSAAKTIRYRVRAGTATAGVHYSTAAEGEVVFGAGISRALIPITIIDNTTPEMDRNFFIEMLSEAGAVLSTTEMTIQNDDVGVQIVRREGTILYVLPIGGGLPYVSLMRSADLVNWEFFANPVDGKPIPVDAEEGVGFFQAYAYSY